MQLKKMIVFTLATSFLLVVSACLWSTTNTLHTPVAVLTSNKHEFFPVAEGTLVTHRFVILNRGSAPLKIENVWGG